MVKNSIHATLFATLFEKKKVKHRVTLTVPTEKRDRAKVHLCQLNTA